MKTRQPYAWIDIHWLPLPGYLTYSSRPRFALTGYREEYGPDDLFSVYVISLPGEPGPGNKQSAKLYALFEEMWDRLPLVGATFLLTTGVTVVARCLTTARGEGEPDE